MNKKEFKAVKWSLKYFMFGFLATLRIGLEIRSDQIIANKALLSLEKSWADRPTAWQTDTHTDTHTHTHIHTK